MSDASQHHHHHHQQQQQLAEYQKQLADIEELLQADPNDASLLALRKDLMEVMALTESASSCDSATGDTTHNHDTTAKRKWGKEEEEEEEKEATTTTTTTTPTDEDAAAAALEKPTKTTTTTTRKKKKKMVSSTFEVPPHLVPLESDSEAERARKRRTIKALKSKWRERVKEVEGAQKQRSWQNFSKQHKKGSIFATEEGIHARVGVISGATGGRTMTEFGERKRHKHV